MNHNKFTGIVTEGADNGRVNYDRAIVESYDNNVQKSNNSAAKHRAIARRALKVVADDPHKEYDIEVIRGQEGSVHRLEYQEAIKEYVAVNRDILAAKYPNSSIEELTKYAEDELAYAASNGAIVDSEQLLLIGLKNKDLAEQHKIDANELGDEAWEKHQNEEEHANLAIDALKEL